MNVVRTRETLTCRGGLLGIWQPRRFNRLLVSRKYPAAATGARLRQRAPTERLLPRCASAPAARGRPPLPSRRFRAPRANRWSRLVLTYPCGSDSADDDAAAARTKPQERSPFSESAAQAAPRDLADDAHRQVRLHGVPARVDLVSDVGIERHLDSAARGFERASAGVAPREGSFDAAAGRLGVDEAARLADRDAAARAGRADVSGDVLELDRSAARIRGKRSVEVASLDPAARGFDPHLSLDVREMDRTAGGVGLEIPDEVPDLDPAAGGVEFGVRAESRDGDLAAGRVDVDRRLGRHFDLVVDATTVTEPPREPVLAAGLDGDGPGALVETEA